MIVDLSVDEFTRLFSGMVAKLREEPEFQWASENIKYALDKNGYPLVKVAAGNLSLDYDLWKGLRNPATIGLYPAGLREIWEFYENRVKKRVDEFGRQTIFQIPRSFDLALKNYNRALIISVMLPFSKSVVEEYSRMISMNERGSSHVFNRMYEDVNQIIDKATTRVAMSLIADDNVVVAMDNKNVKGVSTEAFPLTRQGESHGPTKGGNYPQKSIAVMMGLGQFGIARMILRDEFVDGRVERFVGPLRSIVIFDNEDLITDGFGGIIFPTEAWREFLFSISDFTDVREEINRYRFCTYIPYGDKGCGKCVDCCPSGAQANSVPETNGTYNDHVSGQTHRFWEGKLQFDSARCCEDRGQMTTLLPEWSCARCLSICAAEGMRRASAARDFYQKMQELTKN